MNTIWKWTKYCCICRIWGYDSKCIKKLICHHFHVFSLTVVNILRKYLSHCWEILSDCLSLIHSSVPCSDRVRWILQTTSSFTCELSSWTNSSCFVFTLFSVLNLCDWLLLPLDLFVCDVALCCLICVKAFWWSVSLSSLCCSNVCLRLAYCENCICCASMKP